MHFDGLEPDYVDGQLLERAMPSTKHADCQSLLNGCFLPWRNAKQLFPLPELRIPTVARRYRMVDLAVFRDRLPADPVPENEPYIAIEIVSPDGAFSELWEKLSEYETIGVPHIWVANPACRTFAIFRPGSLIETGAFELPEFGLRIALAQVFA